MVKKKRTLKAGDRVKVGGRLITVPGVPSMTDSGEGEPEKPADELAEEIARAIKAAYQ
jgi:hypothetical protein